MRFPLRLFARRTSFISIAQTPKHHPFTMSKTTYSTSILSDEASSTSSNSTDSSNPKQPLALPEVPHNRNIQLDMSSGDTSVRLDHLGPMVVNADGTMSRISNWEGMTEMEKKQTLRIIGKRNQERLKVLREKEGKGEEKGDAKS